MKNTVLLALILFILVSCAHKEIISSTVPESVPPAEAEMKVINRSKTRAIFHVIAPLGVELVLINADAEKEETVVMDKTLSQLDLIPGFWQVSGFILNGKYYNIMNSAKQFVFHLKKDEITYVGSYIFQCPKVKNTYHKEMRKMNFFNRYPFRSKTQLCELVVGSDFDNVTRVWMSLDKEKHRPLSLGF